MKGTELRFSYVLILEAVDTLELNLVSLLENSVFLSSYLVNWDNMTFKIASQQLFKTWTF